jgi:type I restriction enzyme S subunit
MAGNGDFNVKRYIGKFEAYQRTYVLIPFEDKYQSFLYLLMSLHLGDITGGSRGSVIKFITKGNIADYSFRFPPYCIDDKLAVLNSIYAQVDEHNAEIEHLSRLRDQLLPKLISGDYCC